MEDAELVIKIPQAYYELVLERCKDPVLLNAFKNGTPLPKGHGRLGDLDKLEKDMKRYIILNVNDCVELVNCADTIIKADKGE